MKWNLKKIKLKFRWKKNEKNKNENMKIKNKKKKNTNCLIISISVLNLSWLRTLFFVMTLIALNSFVFFSTALITFPYVPDPNN